MGTLAVTPEAGDASASAASRRKKHTIMRNCTIEGQYRWINVSSRCPLLNLSRGASTSIIMTALNNHVALVENGILCKEVIRLTPCTDDGLSCCSNYGDFRDAVLVKDAGVSCTLLDFNVDSRDTSTVSTPERNLLTRLRAEYNDLFAITRKISACTKDILRSLTARNGRKDRSYVKTEYRAEQPVATQYMDASGRPCLKLRLHESVSLASTQGLPVRKTVSAGVRSSRDSLWQRENETKYGQDTFTENDNEVREPEILTMRDNEGAPSSTAQSMERIFPEESRDLEVESSTRSSSSIYNFLMMEGRRVPPKESPRLPTFICAAAIPCQYKPKEVYDNRKATRDFEISESSAINDCSDFSSREIHFENHVPKTTANFATDFLHVKRGKKENKEAHEDTSKDPKRGMHCTTTIANKCLPDRNLHTVNIRIARRKHADA